MKKLAVFFLVVMVGGVWLKARLSKQYLTAETQVTLSEPVSNESVSPEPTPEVVFSTAPVATSAAAKEPVPENPFSKVIESARKAKSPEEARAILEGALKDHSESPELLAEMGMLYLTGFNQPEKALGYFEQSLSIDGNNGDIASMAANIYVKEKMFGRGAKFLSDLMQRFPDSHTIPVALADILAKQGRGAEGLELLEESGRRAQESGSFSPYLGMMYLNTGNHAKAVEVFQKVLNELEASKLPQDPQKVEWARLDVANALLAKGNVPEAENIVRGVLERAPDDKFAKELLERVQKDRESSPNRRQ